MLELTKTHAATSFAEPLEAVKATTDSPDARRLVARDGVGRVYVDAPTRPGRAVRFAVRGEAGRHVVSVLDAARQTLDEAEFRLKPRTQIACNRGPYGELAERLRLMMQRDHETSNWVINGKLHSMLVCWGRDHVHTLKAMKYFVGDVKSGLEYWLDTQEPNGMFWDCIYVNPDYPAPTWLGEALGEGWFRYDDGMKYIVRRIPVEADCEFLYTEGVWYAWKASGDDAWMAAQLPKLERALKYNASHPDRWSKKHGLVRRSMTMDSWDFVNPLFCNGDHRCINPGDPQFLFHSDNSGLYASHWRMAEMYEHLGDAQRAAELRQRGEALRKRANEKLFFGSTYGHMIPETLDEAAFYAKVGDERKRMSLGLGYTINRRLPTHAMAVKIIREYQRRRKEKRRESFAEWWTMDPPYEPEQWPGQNGHAGCPKGEYMNGAICTIIAGEIAKAAFDHGEEAYGSDILARVWQLAQRDGGHIHQAYRRLPETPPQPKANFRHVDLRNVVNRGLRHGAHKDVVAWTGEGDNDLRNLPVGRRRFGPIEFDVIDPKKNAGRSVLRVAGDPAYGPSSATIPVANLAGRSVYFMHALPHSLPRGAVAATYDIHFADGRVSRIFVRNGHEIALWWGAHDGGPEHVRGTDKPVDRRTTRIAWRGANGSWKNVGLFMYGWDNPRPDAPITAIRVEASPNVGRSGVMLAAISVSDEPVAYETPIRSYGLPDNWAQAAVYYAIAEGLAGIEDAGRAFSRVNVSPRWASTEATEAQVTLHYPASDGYCTYRYTLDPGRRRVTLDLTGSFRSARLHVLLPGRAAAKRVLLEGEEAGFRNRRVEQSSYVDIEVQDLPTRPIVIEY